MSRVSRSWRRRGDVWTMPASALLAASALVLTSCHAWRTQPSVADAAATEPERLQVRLSSGERLTLEASRLTADSLVGFAWEEGAGGRRVALPLASIESVALREVDPLRTGAYVAAVVGLGLASVLGGGY